MQACFLFHFNHNYMEKLFTKGSLLALLVTAFTVTGSIAFAASDASGARMGNHQEMRQAHEQVETAVENGDFAAFKTATANSPMAGVIDTQEEFNKLVEAHTLKEAGDKDGAKAIMDELGIKPPMGMKGGMPGMHGDKDGKGAEVKAAIENGDYASFQALVSESKFAGVIDTEEKFNKLVEACALHEAGDNEAAKAIMDELGVKPPTKGAFKGNGRGHHGERGPQADAEQSAEAAQQ